MPNPVPSNWTPKPRRPGRPGPSAPKMPAAIPPQAPHSPCSGQTPSTSSIFQRFWVSVNMTRTARRQSTPMASAPSGCIRSEPAQIATRPASGPLCTKPGSLRPATSAASVPPDHRHQRVHGDQAGDLVDASAPHHVEAEPADGEDPCAQGQEGNVGRRMRRDTAVLAVAAGGARPAAARQPAPIQPPMA